MIYATFAVILSLCTLEASSSSHCTGECLRSEKPGDRPKMVTSGAMERKIKFWEEMKSDAKLEAVSSSGSAECIDGMAGEYACSGIDLVSHISLKDLGCDGDGSDMWGWTDSESNEYVLATCEDGTSMVDITDPKSPVVLGFLPTNTFTSWWFDVKVYKDYAYIGSEAKGHGMSIFDLKQLTVLTNKYRSSDAFIGRTVAGSVNLGNVLKPNSVYKEFGSSHNLIINEETGFLYAVGSKTCDGGPHILDLKDPANPAFVGCYSEDGYTHDAECVIYNGPDTRYAGREICFYYNEDTLTIVDVNDKSNMKMLSRQGYEGARYTHQGALNPAMSHLFLNDELDEEEIDELEGHTRSMIWDVQLLDAPKLIGNFYSEQTAIDHNEYIHKGVSWQTNYCAGLRVLDARTMESGTTKELAYFDVSPECDTAIFMGSWSSYPFYESGIVAVNSIERGLFLLKPTFKLD